jgi:hypothetical protein
MKSEGAAIIKRLTWISLIAVVCAAAAITLFAFADVTFGLGWGYSWTAVFVGLGVIAWGGAVYLACRGVFRLLGH